MKSHAGARRSRSAWIRVPSRMLVALVVLILAATACGGDDEGADPVAAETDVGATVTETEPPDQGETETSGGDETEPAEVQSVSMRLNVPAYGHHAPFVLAEKMGWYGEEGYTVSFGEGSGSDTTVALIAQGDDDIGLASFDAVAALVGDGADVRSVGVIEQRSPLAIITTTDSEVDSPESLEGATVVMDRGDFPTFEAFAQIAGIDADAVETVTIAEEAQSAALAEGRIDGILGWTTFHAPQVAQLTGGVDSVLWSDYGFQAFNLSMVASNDTIAEDPDLVCGIVRASFKAWEFAQENPQQAVDALVEEFPNVDPEIAMGQLTNTFELLQTDNSEGEPLGFAVEEDIQAMLDFLTDSGSLDEGADPSTVHTNECFEG